MPASLTDRTVLVVGRGTGIARAIALAVRAAGATVVVAGRDKDALGAAYGDPGITAEQVDLTDESSIAALAGRARNNPARRIGNSEDIAEAVVFALTSTFMTGVSLGIDGGEPLV